MVDRVQGNATRLDTSRLCHLYRMHKEQLLQNQFTVDMTEAPGCDAASSSYYTLETFARPYISTQEHIKESLHRSVIAVLDNLHFFYTRCNAICEPQTCKIQLFYHQLSIAQHQTSRIRKNHTAIFNSATILTFLQSVLFLFYVEIFYFFQFEVCRKTGRPWIR